MSLIAYPIAADAHEALALVRQGKVARAVREKEAEDVAGKRVVFVTQSVGPIFESLDEASDAYAGLVEDDRKGRIFIPEQPDRFCRLMPRLKTAPSGKRKSLQPQFKDGVRWPKQTAPAVTVWQLSISYWRTLGVRQMPAATSVKDPARKLRKSARGSELTPEEIHGLSQSPLVAARPQKALDFGLFDFPLPENPGIIIADE